MSRGTVVRSPRLAARRRAVRRQRMRRRRRLFVGVLAAAAIGAGSLSFARSDFFALTDVTVAGAAALSPAAVIEASGLAPGQNVLTLDGAEVAARVRALPMVRDARIEKVGASAIRIVVTERAPALVVRRGAERITVDEDGLLVDAPERIPRSIPVLRAPAGTGPITPPDGETVAGIVTIWRHLPTVLKTEARFFEAGADGLVSLRLGDTTVMFGMPASVKPKVDALRLILARVAAEGAELRRLDIRAPSRPAAVYR